jgi:hypothetical protein
MLPSPRIVLPSIALMLLSACTTTDSVVFVTKTSLGIDVDASTPGASVAYDRVEGYLAPRYSNNGAPAVYASFGTNGNLFTDRKIKQVYATGQAAKTVSTRPASGTGDAAATAARSGRGADAADIVGGGAGQSQGGGGSAEKESKRLDKAMFFGTSTTLGLKVGYSGTALDAMTFGFKRKEISLIPGVDRPEDYPSTLSSFDNQTSTAGTDDTGLAVRQFFATGVAADQLAASPEIQTVLQNQARNAVADYREEERQQTRFVLLSLTCLSKLDDAKLPIVWDHAEALQLFDEAKVLTDIRAATPHNARAIYTDNLRQFKAASAYHTTLLHGHAQRVCKLTGGGTA